MIRDTVDKIKNLFGTRTLAYMRVFDRDNKYTNYVLKDISRFCRAQESCFNKDPRMHALIEGRREVWLRIQEHLNLSPDELLALHKVKDMAKE